MFDDPIPTKKYMAKKSSLPPFSVLMSIHAKESPTLFQQSLESIATQSLRPANIILVCDGPLTQELETVIETMSNALPIKMVRSAKNVGLGEALQLGLKECEDEIIARADTDDISLPHRFEKQMEFLLEHPEIDLIGSSVLEFEHNPSKISSEKKVPLVHEEINEYAKWRNPINHMSVVFRKTAVLKAGGYSSYRYAQDYHLWIKMLLKGCRFANLSEPLVLVSAGDKLIAKRGGFKHFQNEFRMQKEFLKLGFITPWQLVMNSFVRLLVRIIPSFSRKFVYRYFLRKPVKN